MTSIKGKTSDVLLEVNVTVINNADCARYITGNVSRQAIDYRKAQDALHLGINDEVLCTTGNRNVTEQGDVIYSVSNSLTSDHVKKRIVCQFVVS